MAFQIRFVFIRLTHFLPFDRSSHIDTDVLPLSDLIIHKEQINDIQ